MIRRLYLLSAFLFTYTIQAQERHLPPDTSVTTTHEVTILGERVPYTAKAGTQPVWDEDGKPVASLFYTYL